MRAHADISTIEQIDMIEGTFPVFAVPDNCRKMLRNANETRLYVDFPITLFGRPMGKLSCDFCADDLDLVTTKSLQKCHAIAQAAGAIILNITRMNERRTLLQCAKKVRRLPSAFDAINTTIAKHLDCAHLHFFPMLKCSSSLANPNEASAKLVFAQSTSEDLQSYVQSGKAYSLNASSLVSVTARIRHSLRFNNVGMEKLREDQAVRYGIEVD